MVSLQWCKGSKSLLCEIEIWLPVRETGRFVLYPRRIGIVWGSGVSLRIAGLVFHDPLTCETHSPPTLNTLNKDWLNQI